MTPASIIRAIRRKLIAPGSRGPLDTEYRQPHHPGKDEPSAPPRPY